MNDSDLTDMVHSHDKSIDLMAQSVTQLTTAVSVTNGKLDDIIEVIQVQNVLMEKVQNLEQRITTSLVGIDSRLVRAERSCDGADSLFKDKELFSEKVKVINNRIADLEATVKCVPKLVIELSTLNKIKELIFKVVGTSLIISLLGLIVYRSI